LIKYRKMRTQPNTAISTLGSAIGIGLLAGIVGTAAITLSQMIEMKIDGREPSDAPVKAVGKVFDIRLAHKESRETLSQQIHWSYGITWGIARGLISLTGLKGIPASLAHFAAIWGSSMIMLPALKVAPPVTEEKPGQIAIDALHHAVYATATGLAFDGVVG
jgi:hypothetical protein